MKVPELKRRYHAGQWKRVRRAVKDRDNWRCTLCGRVGRLEVHHIKSPLDGGSMYDMANLRTLCRGCHFEEHRESRERKRLAEMRPDRREWARFVQARLDSLGLDNGA